jgi:hypothetical protein
MAAKDRHAIYHWVPGAWMLPLGQPKRWGSREGCNVQELPSRELQFANALQITEMLTQSGTKISNCLWR